MKPQLVADAMTLALELIHNETRADVAMPVTDAWLQEGLEAAPYAQPSGADEAGFVTVGEVRDRRDERTGFVLVHPATKALRISWSNDFGN
jgi:hypothetical protein